MRPRLIIALAALLIAVVAFGGWLLGQPLHSSTDALMQTTQVDDLHITLQLDQAALGQRTVEVAVRDSAGQPVDMRGMRLRFTMTEMDMGQVEADAQPLGGGRYQAQGLSSRWWAPGRSAHRLTAPGARRPRRPSLWPSPRRARPAGR